MFTYQTTLQATEIPTVIVATLTTFPQTIFLVIPAGFMQEATGSLPLILKCSTRQPLRTKRQACLIFGLQCNHIMLLSVR